MILLDANELPFDLPAGLKEEIINELRSISWNRYPDIYSDKLRMALGRYVNMGYGRIVAGNGSDELISLILKALLEYGDKAMTIEPTFSMYSFYAMQCGVEVVAFPLEEDFKLDIYRLKKAIRKERPKLLILCNPNNPTGQGIGLEELKELASDFEGYLLLDEAYYEFYGVTGLELLRDYDNVIILRTLSKAFGLAGLRIGYMVASKEIVDRILAVKSPYNVNSLTQEVAVKVLEHMEAVQDRIGLIKSERERLYMRLCEIAGLKVYPSCANFLLVKALQIDGIKEELAKQAIKTRYFDHPTLKDCIRISIGSKEENDRVIGVLGGQR